ncbi:sigma 54-interacting transcriptional regulator [Paenibacillus naphthalenovorans]|uniref:HTH-type transcriptional regulatory protein TyrR n=2 Tax=Paenibacillus TaxID=44249 RepID=A0A0U2WCM1_9BACL|nr:sigma 54-interacting transcriptional regulator [Paenibacillus naphthalenovorans]ALS25221.1 Fis family transcriptional regulator [Paenibacillus naphthalenovorans]
MDHRLISADLAEYIFNSMHNGLIVVDRDNKVMMINPSAEKMLQIEGIAWKGMPIKSLLPNSKMHHVLENGVSSIGEKMNIAGRVCMVNRTPLYREGEMIGAIGVIQDISEMEHSRNLLKQMEMVIEFSTDGIYVVNTEGITLLVNSAYEEITGFRREELVGRHMAELTHEGYFDQSVSLLVLEQKKRISVIQKIGGKKDVIATGTPVFNESGVIEMVVTSVRDITQLNELKHELNKARSISQIHQHRYALEFEGKEQAIVFRSAKMEQIYEQIHHVAPFPTSILLSGPSGAGKEVVANLIHHLSNRKDKPFIKVNCAAIPEQLLEAELFGYEAGAFTGANRDGRIGLLELADQGTIMFDEIGEMPLSLQVKLLRVLQEKQVQRVGGTKPRNLDIRIISATNRDLRERIREGKFREDLYYRLQVVEIRIPSLAERPEDIEVLVEHYFSYYCRLFRIEKQLSEKTKHILYAYHWPGNVREMRNLIENMIVSVPSTLIEPHHLPQHIYDSTLPWSHGTLKQRVEEFEKRMIQEALEKHKSLRKAAAILGVDHSTLVKKLKRWQLN